MITDDQKAMDDYREAVVTALRGEYGDVQNLTSQNLGIVQALYLRYFERFTNDNNRIWSTGNIFIPLSLAGLTSLKDATTMFTLVLAIGSITLMWFWLLIAENHRAFQNRAQTTMEGIEAYLGFYMDVPPKLAAHKILKIKLQGKSIFTAQNIRWQMFFSVFCIWGLALVYKALH
jgi:hypothetical protein